MTTATPEAIADALAESKARTARLQAQADKVDTAVNEAYECAERSHYRRQATAGATSYRNERDQFYAELEAAMVADPLDHAALFEAFVALKDSDARAGAMSSHASRLSHIDPMPPNAIGAPQARPVLVSEMHSTLTFSAVLDAAIRARCDRIRNGHQAALRAAAQEEISAAVDTARAKAARTAAAQHNEEK
jgi:hypothetical protein